MTATARLITSTYAYHPGSEVPDLTLATSVVNYYVVQPGLVARRPVNSSLQASIRQSGVLDPVKIYTNGVYGVLKDGHHRVKIALDSGVESMPVQIIPDSMKRFSAHRVALEPEVAAWIPGKLWLHETHDVTRRLVGKRQGGIMSNAYLRCDCSCGADWKEER